MFFLPAREPHQRDSGSTPGSKQCMRWGSLHQISEGTDGRHRVLAFMMSSLAVVIVELFMRQEL